MKKILLVSHGNFSIGIKNSLDVVVGSSDNVKAISIHQGTTRDDVEKEFKSFRQSITKDDSVFVITDITAGSTSQYSVEFLGDLENVTILSGLNLGLLLELYVTEITDVKNDILKILEASRENIKQLNSISGDNDSKNEI